AVVAGPTIFALGKIGQGITATTAAFRTGALAAGTWGRRAAAGAATATIAAAAVGLAWEHQLARNAAAVDAFTSEVESALSTSAQSGSWQLLEANLTSLDQHIEALARRGDRNMFALLDADDSARADEQRAKAEELRDTYRRLDVQAEHLAAT